jgi:CDP-diacylglycerol---glycerol-3-phosphate 3-phosphatidyltransferase
VEAELPWPEASFGVAFAFACVLVAGLGRAFFGPAERVRVAAPEERRAGLAPTSMRCALDGDFRAAPADPDDLDVAPAAEPPDPPPRTAPASRRALPALAASNDASVATFLAALSAAAGAAFARSGTCFARSGADRAMPGSDRATSGTERAAAGTDFAAEVTAFEPARAAAAAASGVLRAASRAACGSCAATREAAAGAFRAAAGAFLAAAAAADAAAFVASVTLSRVPMTSSSPGGVRRQRRLSTAMRQRAQRTGDGAPKQPQKAKDPAGRESEPRIRELPGPRKQKGIVAPLFRVVFAWPYRVALAGLYHAGVRPWHLTVLSLFANGVCGWLILTGRMFLGGILLLPAGLLDIFDGALARQRHEESAAGAFLDSVVDRASDIIVFGAIFWLVAGQGDRLAAALALTSLTVSLSVSYLRAQAEALGLTLSEGLMQRLERYVALMIGLTAPGALVPVLILITVLGGATVLQRLVSAWKRL